LAPNTSTNFLVIHSKKLNISAVKVAQMERQPNHNNANIIWLEVTNIAECVRLEQVYIEVKQNLTHGHQYSLMIEFERQLEDELEGFYVSSYYHSEQQKKHYLLTTHFEPTLARTAFPCFDEPAMKATFLLHLLHDVAFQVYFNTDIVRQ